MTTLAAPRPRKRNRPLAAHRKARAVELAIQGVKYDDIAKAVGYSNRGTAYKVVRQALDETIAANVQELRATEIARLDALQAAIWPAAMAGDVEAVGQVLALIDRRAKLLGLYPTGKHKPEERLTPVTVIVPEGWTYDDQRREWDVTPAARAMQGEALRCSRR